MKIGFVSLPVSGHLLPMIALARKLQSRGNESVFINVPDIEPLVRAANLAFVPYCENEYPLGSVAKTWGPVAYLHGLAVIRYAIEEIAPDFLAAALRHLPEKLVETHVDALVVDATHFFIELVPMSLSMPFVQIWNPLHLDPSGATPPSLFSWPHETTPEAVARNVEGLMQVGDYFAPILPIARSYADKVGLKIDWDAPWPSSTSSKLAVITQTPKEFDFPDIRWPAHFHYAGPFYDEEGRELAPFAWEKLNGKPLIYASLGTVVNGLDQIHRAILGAAEREPEVQVVFSVGRNVNLDELGPIPSNTIVVSTAPQVELLKRAALCITHAGLNTALEALGQGVPLVAIPIGYDQPGVAARIAYHGVGEFIEVDNLTVESLSELIQKVLKVPKYRDKASYFQKAMAQTRGLDVAINVIEQVFQQHPESC